MKNIEKDLILKDLDYINNEYDIKMQKLNSIMSLFMDEEPEIAIKSAEKDYKKAENVINKTINTENKVEQDTEEETSTDETQKNEINETNPIIDNIPIDIKSLYRKIVMMTHPDKNHDNCYYTELYKRVIKAKDDNDKAEIIYIAYKLKIKDVYTINEEHFGSIKRKIKEKEMMSSNLNLNSFWIWYHTESPELKRVMTHQINKMFK
jgi:hypothetical protein